MAAAPTAVGGCHETRGLGTRAQILTTETTAVSEAGALLESGLAWIDRLASRFRADSELSALNRSAGDSVAISRDLSEALGVALRAARLTDGRVTPTVGGAMVAIGYDRDFSVVSAGQAASLPPSNRVPSWTDIRVDPAAGTAWIPAGLCLDLGATAKAWAADRIAAQVSERLGCGVLVSLGGDIAVAGASPVPGWGVGVADTCEVALDDADQTVWVAAGGLATSGTALRRWQRGGQAAHHIIDPSTGRPAESCWRAVTVAAATCVDANAAATAAVVMGDAAPEWLEGLGLPARLVPETGAPAVTVGGWPTAGGP